MGYNVKFDNGYSVMFDAQPTETDIEEAYAQITKKVTKSNEMSDSANFKRHQGSFWRSH